MKRLIPLFLLIFSFTANAASRISLSITVTNVPVGHSNLVINANTRLWTNSTSASPSTGILIGASIGESATNLYRQIAAYPYSGPLILGFSSSNVITLQGQVGEALAASLTGTWGFLTFSTQTVAQMNAVRVPASGEPTASSATNIQSQLASDLGNYSTNALAVGKTLVSNLVQTSGTQTIAGNKTWSGSNVISGQITIGNTSPYLQSYDSDGPADQKYTVLGLGSLGFAVSFYNDALTTPSVAFYIERSGGTPTSVTFISPVIATTLQGTLKNSGITNGTTTNMTFTATNIFTGAISATETNITSLANGANAGLNFSGKVFVYLTAGPTGAFSIDGIAGGADGQELELYNATTQNMTIKYDSGTEPVPANRIYTLNGTSDIATVGDGFASLRYSASKSRWIVRSYNP